MQTMVKLFQRYQYQQEASRRSVTCLDSVTVAQYYQVPPIEKNPYIIENLDHDELEMTLN